MFMWCVFRNLFNGVKWKFLDNLSFYMPENVCMNKNEDFTINCKLFFSRLQETMKEIVKTNSDNDVTLSRAKIAYPTSFPVQVVTCKSSQYYKSVEYMF